MAGAGRPVPRRTGAGYINLRRHSRMPSPLLPTSSRMKKVLVEAMEVWSAGAPMSSASLSTAPP